MSSWNRWQRRCRRSKTLIDAANTQVAAHNKMVANLATERRTLTAQVWKFVLEELKTDLAAFKTAKDALDKAIACHDGTDYEPRRRTRRRKPLRFANWKSRRRAFSRQLTGLTSCSSLRLSGLQARERQQAGRPTNWCARRFRCKGDLSEGEKTFVTFLYFYHLLKGSDSDSGMTTDRIVVFDDPVSSLDSDILFIVGSLIKGLIRRSPSWNWSHQANLRSHTQRLFPQGSHLQLEAQRCSDERGDVLDRPQAGAGVEDRQAPDKSHQDVIRAALGRSSENRTARIWGFRIRCDASSKTTSRFWAESNFDESLRNVRRKGEDSSANRSALGCMMGRITRTTTSTSRLTTRWWTTYLKVFRAIFDKSGHSAHYKMMMGDASWKSLLLQQRDEPASYGGCCLLFTVS